MFRVAGSQLRSLKLHGYKRFASTDALTGGLSSWLFGGKPSRLSTFDLPLPGVYLLPPIPDHIEPDKTRVFTLPNGVRIASENSATPMATVAFYIESGSTYEEASSSGASHMLERMAFKSTTNRSQLRLVREVEAIGGHVSASAHREHMRYAYDALKDQLPAMVEVLIDSVKNPAFLDWEVEEEILRVKADIAELSPREFVMEALFSAAYSGALANPLMAPESAIRTLNSMVLEDFVTENYTAPRMILVASGVEQDEVVKLAEPLLSDLPGVKRPEKPKSVYVGGDYRCQADSLNTHIAIAFEVRGGLCEKRTTNAAIVLQILLGGGISWFEGGRSKGIHSRLHCRMLNHCDGIESIFPFNSIYDHSGLFGIYVTVSPVFSSKAVDLAAGELLRVATPGNVTQEDLDRAKNATKSAVLMKLDSRAAVSEDIGRQILTYGERTPVEEFLNSIDAITLSDISTVAKEIISSPLTMVSWGNVIHVPSYESTSRKFHSK